MANVLGLTPETLPPIIEAVIGLSGVVATKKLTFDQLMERVRMAADKSDPLQLPLSQEETDHIVNTYIVPYQVASAELKAAAAAVP